MRLLRCPFYFNGHTRASNRGMGNKVQALRFCFLYTDEIGPKVRITSNMRLPIFILSLLFCILSLTAQDVITKTDGSKIDAKVETVTETHINYRKVTNLNGPVYSIPISSVANIVYENGVEDIFNPLSSTSSSKSPASVQSDDIPSESLDLAKATPSTNISDSYLIAMANMKSSNELKARTLRKIGWFGGGGIALTGTIWALVLKSQGSEYATPVGISTVVGGTIICVGCNIGANLLMKRVEKNKAYTNVIFEQSIYQCKNLSLLAGVNVIGNSITHSRDFGLSFGVKF